MIRIDYLKMCQKVSVLPDGVMGIKKNVPKELRVVYKARQYYPQHLELKFDKGNAVNIAVIHDLRANTQMSVPLEQVEKLTSE